MSSPTPTTGDATKPALKSRGVWAIVLSILAAISALEPAIVEAVLSPLWALLAALGLEVAADTQERARMAAQALIALAAAILVLLSRFISPDLAKLRVLALLALVAVTGGPLACATVPGLGAIAGGGPPPAPADEADPAAVAAALGELGAQAIVYFACPAELRTVEVVEGRARLACAGAPIGALACPAPKVFSGIRIFTDPENGQDRAEPICVDPAPAPPPAPAPDALEP